jgi:hypothetical protein
MAFLSAVDIANRALQRVGSPLITTFGDNTKQAKQAAFAYGKVKTAELRRSVWRFATKRAVLRPLTATTKRFIPPVWQEPSDYSVGAVVQDNLGIYWICMVANTATATNGPGSIQVGQPNNWQQYFGPVVGDLYSDTTSYYAGEPVYAVVDDVDTWYISLVNGNVGNAVGTAADWTAINATDLPINYMVPAGYGVTNKVARNIYPLPNGYLRPAAPDPRTPGAASLDTSAALRVLDWQAESGYFVSANTQPIIFRFVADISDVSQFDDLFCEGLAARLGYELCETLTQSAVKLQACGMAYNQFMRDARNANKLEIGSTETDDDIYLDTIGPAGVIDKSPTPAPAPRGG